ncbi:hypothetical protein Leryth_007218 [Lithospermum erythrorhizon]|nr:hypothetical protein Leryth_007218 [Lithospermum erythrorhizon]
MAAPPSTTPSPSPHYETPPPQLLLLDPPSIASASANRRVPPPCWSHDETVTLLDAYREKWYALRRGNLRAHHWQEVSDEISAKFPASPKTSVQCRHKMEKLRKRYRGEKQRAAAFGGKKSRFKSTWVHFKHMDDMEKGPDAKPDDEDEDDDDEEDDPRSVGINLVKPVGVSFRNNNVVGSNKFGINESRNVIQSTPVNNGSNGYRIRLPVRFPPAATSKLYANCDEFGVPNPAVGPSFGGANKGLRNEHVLRGEMGRRGGVEETKKRSPVEDMVEAIRGLGDRFVKAERMKMDMAREIEKMRMEMEMKRTEMILESQQQIVDAFARSVFQSVSKKQKKMQTPDC